MFLLYSILAIVGYFAFFHKKRRLRLPPGPPGKFLFGNLGDLPGRDELEGKYWLQHKKIYGPISSVNALGKCIIILNEARLAVQLLDKRSALYSSRPQLNFIDMSGWGENLATARSPERVRQMRKYISQEIGSNRSLSRFNEMQTKEAAWFLLRVLKSPDNLQQHIRKEAGAVIVKIGYGYTVDPHSSDPLVNIADRAMADFGVAFIASSWAVNFFPVLKYMPAWMPGAGFVKVAQAHRKSAGALNNVPYEFVKRQMAEGKSGNSFVSNILQNSPSISAGEEDVLKYAAGSLYAGGADTTVSSLANFFLAMALLPEIQDKAQQELDTVIGENQLPQLIDQERLPYINAVVKEVLRWQPVVPMGLPHVSIQDDTCEGYDIPKGAIVLANIWYSSSLSSVCVFFHILIYDRAFTHDETVYHDPMQFKPERFLSSDSSGPEQDPHSLVFGFGRRVCPGRALADANIFLAIAQSLAVFRISKPVRDGNEEEINPRWLPGLLCHLAPYKVSVQPRSEVHREIVLSLEREYPWEKSDAEGLQESDISV
ncbi:hypothetical protein ASPZODRAFT_162256 [Penicilliopsis zonata CBS 506.65]|uniref:Cytochrome P450 n=1 Tax=Penicilliopsis zonata CBS 506.65 TaxID=1073090 RepID=A0A1L9S595_9EURO|nr:hypothetical protein ASPZODRAFT_162256 [Penicilliopsis zonata CBS 506.65]OJJ42336.1 hypothetical protein ASPZODRAFT_162256 [Penicilliopsis zonata CBS 506.65]